MSKESTTHIQKVQNCRICKGAHHTLICTEERGQQRMFNTNEHTDEKGDKDNKGNDGNPDTQEGEHIERMNQQREENEDQRDYEDPLNDKFPDQLEMMWKTNDSCTVRSK